MTPSITLKCLWCEIECHKLFESKAIKSWCKIVKKTKDPSIAYDKLEKWFSEFNQHEDSGDMLNQLLKVLPHEKTVPVVKKWIEQYPKDNNVPQLALGLVTIDNSGEMIDFALERIEQVELSSLTDILEDCFKPNSNKRIQEKILELMHKYPDDDVWEYQFLISRERTKEEEDYLITWIHLNKDNPDIFLMPYSALVEKSSNLNSAVFEWIKNGGRKSEYFAATAGHLLESMNDKDHPELQELIEVSTSWLMNNLDDKDAGELISKLIDHSINNKDTRLIKFAKDWIKEQKNNSQMVAASLIQFHPDDEVVESTKALLRKANPTDRIPVLTGALIRECADKETIGWAKDTYKQRPLKWVLHSLLRYAPDEELVKEGTRIASSEKLENLSPLFLYSILKADRDNKEIIDLSKKLLSERSDVWGADKLIEILDEIEK